MEDAGGSDRALGEKQNLKASAQGQAPFPKGSAQPPMAPTSYRGSCIRWRRAITIRGGGKFGHQEKHPLMAYAAFILKKAFQSHVYLVGVKNSVSFASFLSSDRPGPIAVRCASRMPSSISGLSCQMTAAPPLSWDNQKRPQMSPSEAHFRLSPGSPA